ncbi:MAG TPA: ankyrin repeat domain-containing protein [Ohtaekwangia sp.]|nr:ankyrin repeat domain-containing protein [Ohtaekwangia sp.]
MLTTLKNLLTERSTNALITFVTENPAVLDTIDENGTSGFMLLAYSGVPEVFSKATEIKKSFTFHEAIAGGRIDEVRKQVSEDATHVNQHSPDGFTPLSLAAFFGRDDIARLLLESGANPGIHATNPTRVNALHSAVARENIALCKLFIENGVDVNAPQMQNVTALHSAAHRGNLALVKLLIEYGANASLAMDNGDTALKLAEKDGHTEVVDYLRRSLS